MTSEQIHELKQVLGVGADHSLANRINTLARRGPAGGATEDVDSALNKYRRTLAIDVLQIVDADHNRFVTENEVKSVMTPEQIHELKQVLGVGADQSLANRINTLARRGPGGGATPPNVRPQPAQSRDR